MSEHTDWLAQVNEAALEPDLPICDPHHHLWLDKGHTGWPYTLEDLHADTGSGHNVVRTVFLECGAEYRQSGPKELRPVGETEFVAELAERSAAGGGAEIAGIMGTANLLLGDAVEEVMAAHEAAGRGRFRGVRFIAAYNEHPPLAVGAGPGLMQDERYLAGVRKVGALGYTYDAFCYHPQIPELVEVARACPDVTIVADHLCGPIGVGPFKDKRVEVLAAWRPAMAQLASCPNVVLKLGGIGMPMFGIRWDRQDKPPTSEELAAPWRDEIRFCIEQFGPDRCMFESNFPVDKRGCSYTVLWNAFKRIAADCSPAEKRDLFHDTAARAYRLTTLA
ncbi:MAG: amidohydrolase family protein [Acidimicrobiales bacterium]